MRGRSNGAALFVWVERSDAANRNPAFCFSPPWKEGLGVGTAEAVGGFVQDVLHGAIRIGEHLCIPQAQDRPAFRFQIAGAAHIGFRGREVLAAVQLYCQSRLATSMMKGAITNCRVKAGR
jgi:hypothetical protein